MSDFFVDLNGMNGLYAQLSRARADFDAALQYAQNYCQIEFDNRGIIYVFGGPNSSAYSALTTALSDSSALVGRVATSVNVAQNGYARSDAKAQARTDALKAALPNPPVDQAIAADDPGLTQQHGAFTDATKPTSHLTSPDIGEDGPIFEWEWVDVIDPASWIREACKLIINWDPFEKLTDLVTGRWDLFAQAGEAWGHVGEAVRDIAVNLLRCAQDTPIVWRGNAADALRTFLLSFVDALNRLADVCERYKGKYAEAVAAIRGLNASLSELAGDVVDAVLLAYAAGVLGLTDPIPPLIGFFISEEAAIFLGECAIEVGYEFLQNLAEGENRFNLMSGTWDLILSEQWFNLPELPAAPALT
jgi:hypothetical protein